MYRYAKAKLFKAVIQTIKDINPEWISAKVRFPKIDVHTWIENAPIDKEQGLREISFIVEGYSNTSYEEAVNMANEVAEKLCENKLSVEGVEVVSIAPETSEEIAEDDGNNIVIYRQLNRLIATIKNK